MRRLAVLLAATGMVTVGTLAGAPGAQARGCPPVRLAYPDGVLHARDVFAFGPGLSCARARTVMWLCAGISPRCAVGGGRWWRCMATDGPGDVNVYEACWHWLPVRRVTLSITWTLVDQR